MLLALAVVLAAGPATAAETPTIAARTAGLHAIPGFVPLHWDAREGKLWMEVSAWGRELLYQVSLPAGLGSNDVGLDRGQMGATRVVRFERSGPRVLLVEGNLEFRASSDDPEERRAVREAFAESVLWGFEVAAEEGGRVLVDATAFLVRDAHDVAGALRRAGQGAFRLEASRSAVHLPGVRGFPRNTEVEATLTFTSDEPGPLVGQVAPTPQSITLRARHSLVELPPPGFRPRAFDPRAGYFVGVRYMDFATPVGEPIVKRLVARHRLEKKDPRAAVSEAVRPIVYYLDRATPEPIRSALLEGARWWGAAFEAAGFRDAYRVEMLPEGADPQDLRYNVIQWVHRSTRGWSYGRSVIDPRTGEILKGHVTLGSLRVRQDYLIAEGLLAPYYGDGPDRRAEMLGMALDRLKQLSAHEVGHTLGLAHNYVASVADRASVMDYPHPLVRVGPDGAPDLGRAYASGIGEWDKVAIDWGYRQLPERTDEGPALAAILAEARGRGLVFLTDQDARPPGGASPVAHLWDNGPEPVEELREVMRVRAAALARFSERNVLPGAPLSTLEDALVPIYLYHRYQVEAVVKLVAGVDYRLALRGDGQAPHRAVPPEDQRRALAALLEAVAPSALALPERVLALLPPRAFGYERGREQFVLRSAPAFDPLAAAESAAAHVVSLLLRPERAARLVEQHARDPRQPGLREVLDAAVAATFGARPAPGLGAEVQRAVNVVLLRQVMALAASDRAPAQARALAGQRLDGLKSLLGAPGRAARDASWRAHDRFVLAQIRRFEEEPGTVPLPPPLEMPAGSPIGDGAQGCLEQL